MDSLDGYLFSHLAAHAARTRGDASWQQLFVLIDEHGFLAAQADHFQSFGRSSEDLERYLLPALIGQRDWQRFLHYALVAANLRGLAESLAEPEILEALVRSGRPELAESLAGQLAAPGARARARAVLAAPPLARQDGSFRLRLLDDLREDLAAIPRPEEAPEAEAWCETLEAVARELAPDFQRRWQEWIAPLEPWPELEARAWRAVVEGFLQRGEVAVESGFSEALAHVLADRPPPAFLADALACLPFEAAWEVLDRLRTWPCSSGAAGWPIAMAILSRRPRTGEPSPDALWVQAEERFGPVPWSVPLLERGSSFWCQLADESLQGLHRDLDDPLLQAAFAVLLLEERRPIPTAARTRLLLESVPDGNAALSWMLRLLAAASDRELGSLAASLWGALDHLRRARFSAPVDDLRRSLDLVARALPHDLRPWLQDVLWSPAGRPELLRSLASQATSQGLLRELFLRVESYAVAVAEAEAQGFELRAEILIALACRLSVLRGELGPLDEAAGRLLPEEEDELRLRLAQQWVAAGRPDLAAEAAAGIRDRRQRLLAELRAFADRPIPSAVLSPQKLYEAVASVATVDDERRALAALAELPLQPGRVAEQHLLALGSRARQIEALADLAWHALRFQEQTFPPDRQDRLAAVLPLKQALGVVESDPWLLAIMPELAEVGAQLGHGYALAELQEALDRILRITTAPWDDRARAIEELLARLPEILTAHGPRRSTANPRHARIGARWLRWLVNHPERLAAGTARDDLRRHWQQVLPWVIARAEGLSLPGARYFRHPLQAWLCYEWLSMLSAWLGEERVWSFLAKRVRRLRGFRERSTPVSAPVPRQRRWSWLRADQEEPLRLCWEDRRERLDTARRLLAADQPDRALLATLARLLAREDPAVTVQLVARLPPAERADLALRLLRHGWVGSKAVLPLLNQIEDRGLKRQALIWRGQRGDPVVSARSWLSALALEVGEGRLPASDPATARLRRKLWSSEPAHSLPALARATLRGLALGGREGAEAALRWFLNACLAPRLGEEAGEERRAVQDSFAEALSRARQLEHGTGEALGEEEDGR